MSTFNVQVSGTQQAWAQPVLRERVVLEGFDVALENQLVLELRALGYEPLRAGQTLPRGARVAALLRFTRSVPAAIEVWMPGADGEHALHRRETLGLLLEDATGELESNTPETSRIVALRVTELLRSALRTSALTQTATEPEPTLEPPPTSVRPRAAGLRFSGALAAGALASAGGLPLSAQGLLKFRMRSNSPWGAFAFGSAAPIASSSHGLEGSADVRLTLGAVGLGVQAVQELPLSLYLDVGLGVAGLLTAGDAVAPFTSREDTATTALALAGTELRVELGGDWFLSGAVLGGSAFEAAEVRFAQRRQATWGIPFVLANLGLGLSSR